MKNIIIQNKKKGGSETTAINNEMINTIKYFKNLIQKTLISVQKYKQYDIINSNELNIAIQNLETLYLELCNNEILIKSKTSISTIKEKLENIRSDLNSLFKLYGTDNITDLLNVVFGDTYLKNVDWNKDKYLLLEKYFHPISFKVLPWKITRKNYSDKTIEKNKIIEDFIIVEKSNNLECFDLCRTSKTFQTKVYGIKIAIHNENEKKTLIISGLLDDILTSCVTSDYLNEKMEDIIKDANKDVDVNTFHRYMQVLTLKELLIYSDGEINNKYQGHMNQIALIKQKTIAQVVKEFLSADLYGQRNTLIQLLLKSDEHEFQYLSYLLYDLLSNDNNGNIDTSEQTLLFDSLPWKIKSYFKDAMKETMAYTNNLSNIDSNKIPLEQQICLMKASDSVKEKAMNKLKEIKAKSDDTGSKARTYLDGLLKIPFGIYKIEPILLMMNEIKEIYKNLNGDIKKINNSHEDVNENITSIAIQNNCHMIKDKYINNVNNNIIDNLINSFNNDKRNELIITICKINNIIKKHKLKECKLVHSGKKADFMKTQIASFIEKYKLNKLIIEDICGLKNVCHISTVDSMENKIKKIDDKWLSIKNYMTDVKETLDDAVHGHEKAKRQIERIIAQWINGEKGGYCFGFEGPPGVGKTSFAKKGLAKCLKDENGESRPFSFIAIGGQDNGSTLNGHNYTYVGSEWGKFVDILIKHRCMNPIIFIDELDKVSKTEHGKEIIGILTHLIDPTQNDCFQDKYFNGIDLDLSKALFIFSYNDVSAIDRILLDRIHRIKFEHLTMEDKLTVTRKHILPEIFKNMGVENCIEITDENITFIVENYTNEPGIRKFKELLFEIIGEINLHCLQNNSINELPIKLTNDDIKFKYLKDYHEKMIKCIPQESAVGIINGLWANAMGQGGIIPIETSFYPSNNFLDLKLTGLQGDVMKESMNVAKTLASSLVPKETIKENLKYFEETKMQGIHIHCPEGAVPKDGPSAGTAITSAIYSLLTKRKIKKTVAITGEINLQGKVTAIGGLDLKILGGIKGGVTQFIFPKENEKDFNEFKEKYKEDTELTNGISFTSVENINQVFDLIFEE